MQRVPFVRGSSKPDLACGPQKNHQKGSYLPKNAMSNPRGYFVLSFFILRTRPVRRRCCVRASERSVTHPKRRIDLGWRRWFRPKKEWWRSACDVASRRRNPRSFAEIKLNCCWNSREVWDRYEKLARGTPRRHSSGALKEYRIPLCFWGSDVIEKILKATRVLPTSIANFIKMIISYAKH